MEAKRSITIIVWLLLLSSIVVVATRLHVSTDMRAFLPRSSSMDEQLLLDQLQNGYSNRILLLAIESKDTAHAARLSSALVATLRNYPYFVQIHNGELQLTGTVSEPWFRYRYLLQDSDFSVTALRRALQQRLQELRSPAGLYIRRNLADDPTAVFSLSAPAVAKQTRTATTHHGVWFDADNRAVMFVQTRATGFDLDAQQQNLATIRDAFANLPESESAQLVIGGAPAIAVASRETIRNEARWASIAATLAVALILLLSYRSWRLWLLSALPLAGAMVTALATTSLLFGTLHGITIAFGITLLGIAIDYPIHLFSHLSTKETPVRSLERIWPTLRLGVISTAIGFLSLLFTRFDGLIQLGIFAISGLLAAALVTRYLLPSLLPQNWQGGSFTCPPSGRSISATLSLSIATGLLLLSLGYLSFSDRPLWESDLAALSPIPESMRKQDRKMRDALPVADVSRLLVVQATDMESLLQTEERLKPTLQSWVDEGLLDSYTLAADRLPSAARQHRRQQALPTGLQLQQRLNRAGEGLPFRASAFSPFVAAVTQSRGLPPLTLEQIEKHDFGQSLTGLLFKRRWHMVGRDPVAGADDITELQQRLDRLGEQARYVGLKAVTDRMLLEFRNDALFNLGWGALAILMILGLAGRNPRQVIQIGLPLAAAIFTTLALLHFLGERLTLFHLTSLLLVAGIGIDYGLFFNRHVPANERGQTAHALRVCAISTTTVFAILALSRLPVLHAIGLTVLLGVAIAYWLARMCATQYTGETDHSAAA